MVCVQDVLGNEQYIHVLPSIVNWEHDIPYLPVGIINVDRRHGRVLIELPIEADSGWTGCGCLSKDSGSDREFLHDLIRPGDVGRDPGRDRSSSIPSLMRVSSHPRLST